MPYLGNIPATQFAELKYQDFTGGTGTSFTLNDPVGSAQELEVFVNNVRQEPGVAYTVSGTALTMTGSIVASDDFYVVFQGKSTGTATHPATQNLTAVDGTFTGDATVTGDLTVDTNTLYVDSTNNRVGVGTAAPASLMHLDQGSGGEGLRFERDSYDTMDIELSESGLRVRNETDSRTDLFINGDGKLGLGTASPGQPLEVSASNQTPVRITSSSTASFIEMGDSTGSIRFGTQSSGDMTFHTGGTSAYGSESKNMVLDSNGRLGLGNASPASILEVLDASISGSVGQEGFRINNDAQIQSSTDNTVQFYLNDSSSSAGTHNYIVFRHQGSNVGDIDTTDNSTIRYNTFTGAHWGQFSGHSQPDIKLGTVMSTIDEMCNWTEFEYTDTGGETQKTDIAGTYEIGTTHTIYIDEDGAQATGTAISHDTSQRIAKVKVSDTAGDRTVYGVFAGHYKDGDSSVESLGLGSIRIGSGVTVAIGDLLESAGDGTARPQTGDTSDLIKSSTIAKVTSTRVSHTYDDGSYLVPCVLMAG